MLRDLKEDAWLKQEEEEAAFTIKSRTDHSPIVLFSVLYTPLALTIGYCQYKSIVVQFTESQTTTTLQSWK
jgi:hypothetical protein